MPNGETNSLPYRTAPGASAVYVRVTHPLKVGEKAKENAKCMPFSVKSGSKSICTRA